MSSSNSTLIAFIVILTIMAGLIGRLWQNKRYFYLKTFYYKDGDTQNVIQLTKSGHYFLNRTVVPNDAKRPASFAVDEGTFTKDDGQLVLNHQKGMKMVYHDVESMVTNEHPTVKEVAKPARPMTFQLANNEVHYETQEIGRASCRERV